MFAVKRETCIACMQCIKDCPTNDIILHEGKAHVKNENCIKCGHCVAICPTYSVWTDDYDMDEVKEYNKETFSIEPERLLNFIQFRRSVRRFKEKPVSEDLIEQIIQAGRFTQTGRNAQDVSYTVITGKKLDELRDATYETLKKHSEAILSAPDAEISPLRTYAILWGRMYEAYKNDSMKIDKLFCHAPVAIMVSAQSELDGGLAASNMELMVDALGLGTYFNGFFQYAAQNSQELLSMLDIPEGKKLICCLMVGHPAVKYQRTVPRQTADVTWLE